MYKKNISTYYQHSPTHTLCLLINSPTYPTIQNLLLHSLHPPILTIPPLNIQINRPKFNSPTIILSFHIFTSPSLSVFSHKCFLKIHGKKIIFPRICGTTIRYTRWIAKFKNHIVPPNVDEAPDDIQIKLSFKYQRTILNVSIYFIHHRISIMNHIIWLEY